MIRSVAQCAFDVRPAAMRLATVFALRLRAALEPASLFLRLPALPAF
ncbi:MAG: hypothetical protein JJT88_01195 [Gammaproteobacteria bacterium]|nr:hypothetical protein [Gammaproteobacteria bacterium]